MSSNRRQIFRAGVVDLGMETATLPNGLTIDLPIIRHPGAAAVVAIDEGLQVAMIHQYRYAAGGTIWEIPAGAKGPAETPHQCAIRELREETGVIARRWDRLGSIITIPSICDERIELFLARELTFTATEHEADEVIRLQWIALAQALEMISEGQIIDAKTIAGLFEAQAFLAR